MSTGLAEKKIKVSVDGRVRSEIMTTFSLEAVYISKLYSDYIVVAWIPM